jgi:hypothetical protein
MGKYLKREVCMGMYLILPFYYCIYFVYLIIYLKIKPLHSNDSTQFISFSMYLVRISISMKWRFQSPQKLPTPWELVPSYTESYVLVIKLKKIKKNKYWDFGINSVSTF